MDSDLERFWGGLREVCSGSSSATVRSATRDVGDRHIRELQAAREELAELRRLTASYELRGVWPDGDEQLDVLPDRIVFVNEDGEPEPRFAVNARPLLDEALRRQAREWCRSIEDGEGPPLEQLLALVPQGATLTVEEPIVKDGWDARWELYTEDEQERGDVEIGQCIHSSLPVAIRAATCELLGLVGAGTPTPRSCGTCLYWERDSDEPAKPCRFSDNGLPRTAASSCPDRYERHPCAGCDVAECQHRWELRPCPDCGEQLPWCRVGQTERPLCLCTPTPVETAGTDPAPDSDQHGRR